MKNIYGPHSDKWMTLKLQYAKPSLILWTIAQHYLNVELWTKNPFSSGSSFLSCWSPTLWCFRCLLYLTHQIQIISSTLDQDQEPLHSSNSTGRNITTTCKQKALVHKLDWVEVSELVHQSCLWSSCAILVYFVNSYSILKRTNPSCFKSRKPNVLISKQRKKSVYFSFPITSGSAPLLCAIFLRLH